MIDLTDTIPFVRFCGGYNLAWIFPFFDSIMEAWSHEAERF